MDRAVVILGEASETDSEDEARGKSDDSDGFSNTVRGILVTGEDSESDNESDKSVASAISALEQLESTAKSLQKPAYNSLLHKKLREDNASFRSSLNSFCNTLVNDASNTLSGIEQQIVHSEVTLQNAISPLKNLNVDSDKLQNKLHSMLSDNFLSNVKVDK